MKIESFGQRPNFRTETPSRARALPQVLPVCIIKRARQERIDRYMSIAANSSQVALISDRHQYELSSFMTFVSFFGLLLSYFA
jgi:hypothetical protein